MNLAGLKSECEENGSNLGTIIGRQRPPLFDHGVAFQEGSDTIEITALFFRCISYWLAVMPLGDMKGIFEKREWSKAIKKNMDFGLKLAGTLKTEY
jgi:hypothetical protein